MLSRSWLQRRLAAQLDALVRSLGGSRLELDLILQADALGRSNGSRRQGGGRRQRDAGLLEVTEVQRIGQVAGQLIEAILQTIVGLDNVQRRDAHVSERAVQEVLLARDDVGESGLAQDAARGAMARLE